jgi:hypothetical protein
MRGTLAECVQRWLDLPQHEQQDCMLTNSAAPGQWGSAGIRAYVALNGLPPRMAPVSPDRLKEITSKQLLTASPFQPFTDSSPRPRRE